MELGISQYLRFIRDGVTLARWQNGYHGPTVTWQGAPWIWVPFTAGGMVAGVSGDETGVTISAPATRQVRQAFEAALAGGHLVELTQYQFDPLASPGAPPVVHVLQAQFIGQVVGASASLTTMTAQLGTALDPVGSQVPPRALTTEIMGVGCRL
jgi:hypothetical protein